MPRGWSVTGKALKELPTRAQPSQEEIARRAYELFEQRGRQAGHDLEDWLEAERQLRARASPRRS